ncbi:uncharacterized protein LOC125757942 [Rhipicephalus sanguineus]|uniref:Uncharacterized protein n=1 Tax=Rhipicephalus sanguineus TaxID=34632 RepID=A0A9D4SYV4_RHISA|nr:uncharacterized protein LOC125757942 [Rhipicephalus sanguineus]KAH7962130.1 hypothetical protein HPB52_014537 [Rhipicephalus sanguineus]
MGEDVRKLVSAIWSLFWLVVLLYLAFWVAFMCAFWYIVLLAFVPCVPALKQITDGLHKGVRMPYICSENMMHGRNLTDGLHVMLS